MLPRATRVTPCARANRGPVAVMSKPKARPWRSSSARLAPVPQPQSSSRKPVRPAGRRGQPGRDEPAEAPEPEVRALGAVGEFEQAIEMVHADAPARLRASGGHGTIRPACASAGLWKQRPSSPVRCSLTAALTYPLVVKLDRVGRVNTDDGTLRALERGVGGRRADRASHDALRRQHLLSGPPRARLLGSQHRRGHRGRARVGAHRAIRISPTTPWCSSPS